MKILLTYSSIKKVDLLKDEYILALKNLNYSVDIELVQSLDFNLENVCGVVFTGGKDIHPEFFNSKIQVDNLKLDRERDVFELKLYKEAKKRKIPVLGICRGFQLINIAEGGDIYQDLTWQYPLTLNYEHRVLSIDRKKEFRRSLRHLVKIIDRNSYLYDIFRTYTLLVNSRHHQGLKRVSDRFNITAVSDDGIIESIEYKDKSIFIIGVQWHPEQIEIYNFFKPLFRYFLDKVKLYCENKNLSFR